VRHATSIAEVGTHPLSRTDRAAMELALCLLRQRQLAAAACALNLPDGVSLDIDSRVDATASHIRIRLALLLRTLLRVDRGDYGPRLEMCTACGWSERAERSPRPGDAERWKACPAQPLDWLEPLRPPWTADCGYTPLWESAPAHDDTTARQRRERRAT
jgi:hypothetical protein